MSHERAQAAWERIERLGGHGVWESDMVVVSLANAGVKDGDLALCADFPHVQTLDLSDNPLTDACLKHLDHLTALESLILINTSISSEAAENFAATHPGVQVKTQLTPADRINPFTGEPFDPDEL